MATDKGMARYRAAVAVEMRMTGTAYDDIARELGYANRSGAWKAVQRSLTRRVDRAVEQYRDRALVDLEILQEKSWAAACRGDDRAVGRCLGAIDQRSRLLGLYEHP